jgi:quinol-cytochrome oxidoreductase complex cytochrome b subunit
MLATKANPITLLTGISHELLNNWHSWAAWAMFVLALVHTFPFIVYHIRVGDIVEQWNDGGIWVTGVVALLAQAWLTFASIPWLRYFPSLWSKAQS